MKVGFSRVGFILASIGSAVGLGNIWKFPYITGENGGGAFVLVYLLTIAFVGFSLLIAEITIGKLGRSDNVTSFESLGGNNWKYAGFMAFNGLVIMTFYSVVIGWILYYIYSAINGLPTSIEVAEAEFSNLIGSEIIMQIMFHLFATLTVLHFVNKGIKGGIEILNRVLVPALFSILIILLVYSSSFEGFGKAVDFLFEPNWEKLTSESIIMAIGHGFFTLSLGMGAILTYSASLPKDSNVTKSALSVTFFDTLIALIAGLIIFSLLFQFNESPAKGPGLVFISLPVIFSQLGDSGVILSILFLVSLAFAGLTSAVSLVEPAVLYVVNRWKITRFKATIYMGALYFFIGIFAILSYSTDYGETFSIAGTPIFDILEKTTDSILLPLSGILMAIFIGYRIEKTKLNFLKDEMGAFVFRIWLFSIKYVAPIAVLFLMLNVFGLIKV